MFPSLWGHKHHPSPRRSPAFAGWRTFQAEEFWEDQGHGCRKDESATFCFLRHQSGGVHGEESWSLTEEILNMLLSTHTQKKANFNYITKLLELVLSTEQKIMMIVKRYL